MKARQFYHILLLGLPLACLLPTILATPSSAFLTFPPLQQRAPAPPMIAPATRKRKQVEPPPEAPPPIPNDRGIVVVVVSEKTTRFYHGLLRPPFGHRPPAATYVHPPDPYQFEKHGGRGHPRHYRGKQQGLHSSHNGGRQSKPGSSQWSDQQHYMRAIEEHIAAASRALVIGHGKAKGEAADILLKDLTRVKPLLREKVISLVRLDDMHLTDRQILQVVRQVVFGADPRKDRIIHGQEAPPSDT